MKAFTSFVTIVLLLALGLGVLSLVAGHSSACAQRQRQYDGQFVITQFLAKEIGATPAQRDKAVADLRATLGARPAC